MRISDWSSDVCSSDLLPVMRSAGFESDMKKFTGIFKARAAANGVTFVPTHDLMTDKDGNYSAYGLDASGRKRLLRAEDGIHFSMQGYELLARTVGHKIVRSEEHTSELQSLMRISYAVFCLKTKKKT